MPTSNITITPTWTKVADTAVLDFLATFTTPVALEFATTTADTAPTVQGHQITNASAVTRSVLGVGYVWAKTIAGSKPSDIPLVVTK